MRKLLSLIVLIALFSSVGKSQGPASSFFGLRPPGNIPEVFAPGIVSTSGFEHSKIGFSADGSVLYWATEPPGEGVSQIQQKIWFARKSKGVWSSPEILKVSQIAVRCPTLYPPSGELFFIGSDDPPTTDPHKVRTDLYRIENGNESARKITDDFPLTGGCWSFSFAANGNLYFDNPDNKLGIFEIYFSEFKNGSYSAPRKMEAVINDGSDNLHPFISPDEKYLIFCSFRKGGYGIADLYISFRNPDGQWTEARNMGSVVNSEMLERFPSVSPDGKYLFFTKNGGKASDYYWVSASVIGEHR
jgi:hypothetical protein